MTKSRRMIGILTWALLAATLSGCGDGSEEIGALTENSIQTENSIGMPEPVQMEIDPVLAQPEQTANEIKLLYQTGNLKEEEEAAVLDAMESLYRNLDVEEYLGESIHMVCSREWFETMAVRLYEGCRSYTLQQGDTVLLSAQVGYDISGEPYANVSYQADENSLSLLKQTGSKVSLMQAGISDGEYHGAFETWQIDSEEGQITREQGTYDKGILVGEYIVSTYKGNAGDAFDLWTNRENMEYETKTITYNEKGEVIAESTPEPTATPAPTKTPAATKAPTATKKPTVTPKPVQTPAPTPTPAPTQPPEENHEDDNHDDGGNNDGGNDNGGNDGGNDGGGDNGGNDNGGNDGGGDNGGNGGGDSGGGDSGATGGDTDIDWSPDLM